MSYQLSLEEMNTNTIIGELLLRIKHFNDGNCHYCGRPFFTEKTCKMYKIHKGEQI